MLNIKLNGNKPRRNQKKEMGTNNEGKDICKPATVENESLKGLKIYLENRICKTFRIRI